MKQEKDEDDGLGDEPPKAQLTDADAWRRERMVKLWDIVRWGFHGRKWDFTKKWWYNKPVIRNNTDIFWEIHGIWVELASFVSSAPWLNVITHG